MSTNADYILWEGGPGQWRHGWLGYDNTGVLLEVIGIVDEEEPDRTSSTRCRITTANRRHRRSHQHDDDAEASREFTVGPDLPEGATDAHGRVIDDDYVAEAVEQFRRRREGPGRPRLHGTKTGDSPLVQFRTDPDTKQAIKDAAAAAGIRTSDWLREVVRQALSHRA